jgi:hypothetical protein
MFCSSSPLPTGRQWIQILNKNGQDALGCAANKRRGHRPGANPLSDADEMGDSIKDCAVAEAQWSCFYDTVRIEGRRWKRKNTAREVKGSADASFRADLKSKVSQATKKAGEFQIRKRGALTQCIAPLAKKGKPTEET